MRIGRIVEVKAQGHALTLAELRAFVAELDEAGAADNDTTIEGTVRIGGGVKALKASAVRLRDGMEVGNDARSGRSPV